MWLSEVLKKSFDNATEDICVEFLKDFLNQKGKDLLEINGVIYNENTES